MSNQSDFYNFKFVYTVGSRRLCAYINHGLNFAELKEFLLYWICKLKHVPCAAQNLYWIDADGDQFDVTNEMEYKMFKMRNTVQGVLFGTSNGIKHSKTSPVSCSPYTHFCENCEACGENKYMVNVRGEMICTHCTHKRGFCCLLVIESSSNSMIISINTKDLSNALCENDKFPESPDEDIAAREVQQPSGKNVGEKEDEFDITEPKPLVDINGAIEKMCIYNNTAATDKPKKSTGAIPKVFKNVQPKTSPFVVEHAVKKMMTMGFDNENFWLTDLLMSTGGKIDKALDKILTEPAFRSRKLI